MQITASLPLPAIARPILPRVARPIPVPRDAAGCVKVNCVSSARGTIILYETRFYEVRASAHDKSFALLGRPRNYFPVIR